MECPSCKTTMVMMGNVKDKKHDQNAAFVVPYQCPACGYFLEKEDFSNRY